jgi:putative colanic acid biosynthesis acetyltransferase WcaF
MSKVDLSQYSIRADQPDGYHYGRPMWVRLVWHFVSALLFQNQFFPLYGIKVKVLRAFGAKIGEHVLIKPDVTIKYPWWLELGDHVWIGEKAWLDCTTLIRVGSNVIVSQGAFLCCGAHDFKDPGMGSFGSPITVEDGVWICAFAKVATGVTIHEDAVVLMNAVVLKDCEANGIYRGDPAEKIGERKIRDYVGPKREEPAEEKAAALAS